MVHVKAATFAVSMKVRAHEAGESDVPSDPVVASSSEEGPRYYADPACQGAKLSLNSSLSVQAPRHHADPACQGAGAQPQLGVGLAPRQDVPRHAITAQEAAEVLGVWCGSRPVALIRQKKIPATRRCNRHVLKYLADVLDARLGTSARRAVAGENLERHHPPGDPAVRAEARRGLRVVRRPQMHRRHAEECDSAARTLRLVFDALQAELHEFVGITPPDDLDADKVETATFSMDDSIRGFRNTVVGAWTIRRLDTGVGDADRDVVFNAMDGARRELCRLPSGVRPDAATRVRPAFAGSWRSSTAAPTTRRTV